MHEDSGPIQSGDDERRLVAWLADHDEPCPRCGYSLGGLTLARCPECGARLELGVESPDLILRWFILGVIGLSLALGFDGVTLVVIGIGVLIYGPGPPPGLIVFFFFGTLVLGCGLGMWWRRRGLIQRWSLRRQWITVAVLWCGLFLAHLAFMGAVVGWW